MKERQALTRQLVATEKKLIQLGGTNPPPSSPSLPKSPSESLEDMSLRMQEMNARHRSTVAEMERGSSRVRQELTIKLSKLSDLVLTMNEENAKTRGELKRAQDRIEVVTAERNYFVKETQVLEAELRELTKTKPDPTLVARLEAETARASELDGAVLKLSSRLQSAMSIIRELENTPHNTPQKAVNFLGAQPPRPPPSASSSHSQMLVKVRMDGASPPRPLLRPPPPLTPAPSLQFRLSLTDFVCSAHPAANCLQECNVAGGGS